MKDGEFEDRDLQVVELAAGKSGRCLEGVQATWTTLKGHLKEAGFELSAARVLGYGGLRLWGTLSTVECIVDVGDLSRKVVHVIVFYNKAGIRSQAQVVARGKLDASGFAFESRVLDFVLGREGEGEPE